MSEEKKKEKNETLQNFDMYHFFSRKDVVLAIIFIVAFLIFSLAMLLVPQVA